MQNTMPIAHFTIAYWSKFTTWTGDPAFVANKNWNSGRAASHGAVTDPKPR